MNFNVYLVQDVSNLGFNFHLRQFYSFYFCLQVFCSYVIVVAIFVNQSK